MSFFDVFLERQFVVYNRQFGILTSSCDQKKALFPLWSTSNHVNWKWLKEVNKLFWKIHMVSIFCWASVQTQDVFNQFNHLSVTIYTINLHPELYNPAELNSMKRIVFLQLYHYTLCICLQKKPTKKNHKKNPQKKPGNLYYFISNWNNVLVK